ncbi:MAG TPA: nitrogenase iron-molybdenum cofactor biosynthesis protein NifE [Nitrospirota bacterium]
MVTTIDKLTVDGCSANDGHKLCRARGGESCAFDGAMIVLQPIADTAHLVHGPIACCGNSWEGRGALSSKGNLHTMGFTTDMTEIDIVYGAEEKLRNAIVETYKAVSPKAIFVYSTCVSGLIGEDIVAVCKKAENDLGIRIIPVNAPGFVGPKNLGNRIAGDVLLEQVIGTGEPPVMTHTDINLIGEYNIAGDLWHVEPLLARAGIRVLSKITGDSTFEEITWAHRAKLNVVVCSRALINVAHEMERKYGIPYVEVSFFGSTEIAKALRAICYGLDRLSCLNGSNCSNPVDTVIKQEERKLKEALKPYKHLRGKKAVLYTGGVKSWSFISALRDLSIEIVAVGTKKSTIEDEEKMKELLGPAAPLVEDVAPKNLLKLLKDRRADMLIAGGRNQYLAVKEGYPFVDVNQERHTAYAGYQGLVNLAEQISNSINFYDRGRGQGSRAKEGAEINPKPEMRNLKLTHDVIINPLKHSPAIGAAIALQGIDKTLPIIHGAQGCTFLGKVLLTKHFREPIALASSKLFIEDVVMGSEEKLVKTIEGFIEKTRPAIIGVLTSGMSEVKGDNVEAVVRSQKSEVRRESSKTRVISIPTPDYEGGLETGYAKAVEATLQIAECGVHPALARCTRKHWCKRNADLNQDQSNEKIVNVLAGSHLTPADFNELREIIESFGMRAIILPDLSALDGSRQGFSPLATGGTTMEELRAIADSSLTICLGMSMEPAAKLLRQRFGIECCTFDSIAGLANSDRLMRTLAEVSGNPVPVQYERQRRILVDAMRDAHFFFGDKKICIALEPDLAAQTSKWLDEMGAVVELAVIPTLSDAADHICAQEVRIGDLSAIQGEFDVLIANSHAEGVAKKLGMPLYEMGFPVYKTLGYTSKVTIGYRGTVTLIHEVGNLLKTHI